MKLNTIQRKKFRVTGKLKKVSSPDRLRLSISRSANNISAQIIDDTKNITVVSCSSVEKDIRAMDKTNKTEISKIVAEKLAKKAQEKKIKGRVVEQLQDGSEVSIPGANVYWEGTTIGVATNSEGYYLIPSPKKYPSTMIVSYVGYQAYSQEITEWSHYHIYLKPSVELGEVKVKGKVNTTKFSTINTINMQTLSTGELEKAACCNLSESFSTNATVDVTFTDAVSGAKKIQMLGLDGVYTQITQENIPLIRGMTSTYGLSYVPGTWIESIQIIKGSGSVVNGFESFAGQINLEYYKPQTAPKLFWNAYTNSEGKLENNLLFAKKSASSLEDTCKTCILFLCLLAKPTTFLVEVNATSESLHTGWVFTFPFSIKTFFFCNKSSSSEWIETTLGLILITSSIASSFFTSKVPVDEPINILIPQHPTRFVVCFINSKLFSVAPK